LPPIRPEREELLAAPERDKSFCRLLSSKLNVATKEQATFSEQAEGRQRGLVAEFWVFLRQNKKWWLTPIILVLLIIGIFVILGGTAVAPFIYTLF
jgi:hypothetical protein